MHNKKSKESFRGEIALVTWMDAATRSNGWTAVEDLDTSLPIVYSVGIIIERNKDHIALVQSARQTDDDVFNLFIIPAGMINKIEILKKA